VFSIVGKEPLVDIAM
jgi:citrate synthase